MSFAFSLNRFRFWPGSFYEPCTLGRSPPFSEPHFLPLQKGVDDSSCGQGSEESRGSPMLSTQLQPWDSIGPLKCQLRRGAWVYSTPQRLRIWEGLLVVF